MDINESFFRYTTFTPYFRPFVKLNRSQALVSLGFVVFEIK